MADAPKQQGPNLDPNEVKKFTMGFNGATGSGQDAAQSQLDAMKRRALKSQDSM